MILQELNARHGVDDILFGQIAVCLGLVAEDHIIHGLDVQRKKRLAGTRVPVLGRVLVNLGYMTDDDVRKVRTAQSDGFDPAEHRDDPPSGRGGSIGTRSGGRGGSFGRGS